jgi:acyl carrier protein
MLNGERAGLLEAVCGAVAAASPDPSITPRASDRLVDDLGFDSLRISNLALELERVLGVPVLLNDWIADAADVDSLTVAALAAYLDAGPSMES